MKKLLMTLLAAATVFAGSAYAKSSKHDSDSKKERREKREKQREKHEKRRDDRDDKRSSDKPDKGWVAIDKIDWTKAEKLHTTAGKNDVLLMKVDHVFDGHQAKCYLVRVDLSPSMMFTATPRDKDWGKPMPADEKNPKGVTIYTLRQKTLDFMESVAKRKLPSGKRAKPILAFNTSPWGPWPAPKHLYAAPNGYTVSDGEVVKDSGGRGALFIVYKDGSVDVRSGIPADKANDVWIAHNGFQLVLKDGNNVVSNWNKDDVHPRMGLGITADKKTLYLLAIDGRSKGWSDGATPNDMAVLLKSVGVTDAVNFDGGGSTSLFTWDHSQPTAINKVSGRPTALNICIYESK